MNNTNVEHVITSILIYMYEFQEQHNIIDKCIRNVYMLKTLVYMLFPTINMQVIVQYCDNKRLNQTIVQSFLKLNDHLYDPSYETFKDHNDNIYLDTLDNSFTYEQQTRLLTEYVALTKYIHTIDENNTIYDNQIYDEYMNQQLIYVIDKLRIVNSELYNQIVSNLK